MRKICTLLLTVAILLSLNACTAVEGDEDFGNSGNQETSVITDNITFEEMTVVDNDSCVIRITQLDPDDMWGYGVKVYFENKTADKTLMFSVEDSSINGVVFDTFFAKEVTAGKKANETISFDNEDLAEIIGDFTDIALGFRVYNSEDWAEDSVAEITTHIYPYGEESAIKYSRESLSSDIVLLDNDYVTMLVTGFDVDDIWGYTANVYLVNKTDNSVMFSADNVSVNGYMIDPFYAASVSAGNCAFSEIIWSEESLAENNIAMDSIDTIEMTVRAYNNDDWQEDDYANETVTLNP